MSVWRQCIRSFILLLMQSSLCVGDARKCYSCSGILCVPRAKYIRECKASVSQCYFVAGNETDIYRGCYGDKEPYHAVCVANRLKSCAICSTDLCNDQPLYLNEHFSCIKCNEGQCTPQDPLHDTQSLACAPTFNNNLNKCYSMFNFGTNKYRFGCYSELTLEEKQLCDFDWYRLACRLCLTPNCNYDFFYTHFSDKGEQLKCHGSDPRRPDECTFTPYTRPYYGCFQNEDTIRKGCFNKQFGDNNLYYDLMTRNADPGFYVCPGSLCNNRKLVTEKQMICYDDPIVMECGAMHPLDAPCMKVVSLNGSYEGLCENRYPCEQQDLFLGRCAVNNTKDDKALCLENMAKPNDRYICYACINCATLTVADFLVTKLCAASDYCVEVLTKDRFYRGCNADYKHLCSTGDCVPCSRDYCNNNRLASVCYVCDTVNSLCAYEPLGVARSCPTAGTNLQPLGCVYGHKAGQVIRSCQTPSNACPHGFACTYCKDNYCNSEKSYMSACIQCNGTTASNCARNRTFLAQPGLLVTCPIQAMQALCSIKYYDGEIYRDCTFEVDHHDRALCSRDADCFYCDTEACNYITRLEDTRMRARSGVARVSLSGMQIAMLVLSHWLQQNFQ